jgi:hypothetical protein
VGLALVLTATSKYGAGVSSDSARNLSTADSLLMGRGFVDMLGTPLVLWPPLYPLLLAGLSYLSGLGTFQVAWYLNAGLHAGNIWLAGWLLFRSFPERPFYAVVGALAIVLSRSVLRIHANVASEPLFETLMLLFFFAAAEYLRNARRGALWAMCALAAVAALHRYLGVVLIGVAGIAILRREGMRGLLRGAIPLAAATLPLVSWLAFHNYGISGTLFGPRELSAMLPLQNISLSLTKMLWWFVPRLGILDWIVLHPWLPLASLALILAVINKRSDARAWLAHLSTEYVWPGLVFAVAYFLLLAFTVVTTDHLDLTSDRYYVVLLPTVLAFVFITFHHLAFSHVLARSPRAWYGLAAMVALWLAYPAYGLQSYVRQALIQGEPTNYNIANSANFREMNVVRAAEPILAADPLATVYSNYVNIVWFIYDHPVEALPFQDQGLPREQRLEMLEQNYPDWPAGSGYVIWFTPNQYHHIVPPSELATIANLTLLFEDETGQIFAVRRGSD